MSQPDPAVPRHPGFLEALVVWIRIGLLSFGGPVGQIALMHRELVEKRRWVSGGRFLHALNYCMVLPGPEAQQLAIYIGWLLHRVRGGVVAGTLFVLPGAILMWVIAVVYVQYGKVGWIEAIFHGLKPAVIAIVIGALLRIGRRTLKHPAMWAITGAAFAAIFLADVPFPLIILTAGVVGLIGGRYFPQVFDNHATHGGAIEEETAVSDAVSHNIEAPTAGRTIRTVVLWSALWLLPVMAAGLFSGRGHILTQEGIFFSKAAVVTFGGAYAVLPYVAQQAVETHGWLEVAQMMDGLALAETTPGPLILVLQFVGFLGGWNQPGDVSPLMMATAASLITTWCTFVPGFLFIFAGGPYVERSRANLRVSRVLSAVTAAVVGVILNLSVWFGWHVFFPEPGRADWFPIAMVPLYFYLLHGRNWDIPWVIGLAGLVGIAWRFSFGG